MDLTGQRFGRLIAEGRNGSAHFPGGQIRARWLCRCDCGNTVIVTQGHLRSGRVRSCNCLNREMTSARSVTHGASRTPEYECWAGIIKRCENQSATNYANYGGRGITMCARWRESFEAFLADMGHKPSPAHSIDRTDNNRNYEPDNCRWATRIEQNNNKRPYRRQHRAPA